MMGNRRFDDVVEGIKTAEKDVDKVLDAAKLQRNEIPGTRLNAEQKMTLALCGMGFLAIVCLFFMVYLSTR